MHAPLLARSEKQAIAEVKKAFIEARVAAKAKMQEKHFGLSENEQALFYLVEREMGLDREALINNLRRHKKQEFDQLVSDEFKRNLNALGRQRKWIKESFKALEIAVIPVKATDEQHILGWNYRFKDEITGTKCPPIREIFRRKPIELPDMLLLADRKRFIQEVKNRYDRKIFEIQFDRRQVGWNQGKNEGSRFFTVKFMLRAPWCRVLVEGRPL